jgi:hypothetical protein
MFRFKTMILASLVLRAAVAWGQEKSPAAPMDDACAKHCQRGMGDRKAMMEKNAAAWKEIRAAVDAAKNAKGDQRVADLETALDHLVAFHETMMAGSGGPMPGMPGMGGKSCCGGMGEEASANGAGCCADGKSIGDCCGDMHAMNERTADCCGGKTAKKQANMACCADKKAMADCCGPDAKVMKADCPMTKKGI